MTTYTYTVNSAGTFPNRKVDLDSLAQQVRAKSDISVALDSVSVSGGNCLFAFRGDLSSEEVMALEVVISAHTGNPVVPTIQAVEVYSGDEAQPVASGGRPRVVIEKTDSTKATIISHDWSDPTTWAEAAVRVVDEVASDDGAHTVYSLAHSNVIDTYHGKTSQEDFLLDAAGNSYRVAVKVNDVAKAEQDPHFGTGGDFMVNYVTGKLTFLSALQPSDVVKVTYHYATSSQFTVKPLPGKALVLDFAEVQFSEDVVMTDSVVFQPYGFVEVFAPQYCTTNGGPYPPGTKVPLGNPIIYKAISDFQNDAVKSYIAYPAFGGTGWRGSTTGILVLDWDYVSSTRLRSDYGMEILLTLAHDVPFGGWYATATFYCLVDSL